MGKYDTCPETRAKIDDLMRKNASYQAQNNCITNTAQKAKEINQYCNREFIRPIKDLDEQYYKLIKFQSD